MEFSLICWCAELSSAYANYSNFFLSFFFYETDGANCFKNIFFSCFFFNRFLALKQLLKNSLLGFPWDN